MKLSRESSRSDSAVPTHGQIGEWAHILCGCLDQLRDVVLGSHEGVVRSIRGGSWHGPINVTAPEPVTMHTFCEVLGRVLHRPSWLPIPSVSLKILLGELGTLMTTGQRVIPAKAMAEGSTFHYPTLDLALRTILKKPIASEHMP